MEGHGSCDSTEAAWEDHPEGYPIVPDVLGELLGEEAKVCEVQRWAPWGPIAGNIRGVNERCVCAVNERHLGRCVTVKNCGWTSWIVLFERLRLMLY